MRATLEAIAYQSRDLVECIQADSGYALAALRVDGGACRNDFLMQFQADILGIPVHRPKNLEVTALGAAGLAGIGAGVWEGAAAFTAATSADLDIFEPQMTAAARAARYEGWRDAVARTRSQTSS